MNCIVTGASRGLGFETCMHLLQDGHNVIAIARNETGLNKLVTYSLEKDFTGKLHCIAFDLTLVETISDLIDRIAEIFETVDVLINNAGALVNKSIQETTVAEFDYVYQINVKAPYFLVQACLPHFAKDSHVLNISSMGGFQSSNKFPGLSVYSSSKGALSVLTECLAVELSEKNIKVNCLALGAAQTEMLEEAFPGYNAPLKADEMASFISYFAVNGSKFFNGKVLPVSLSSP